jgi:nucleoside 2-deoxyribosyltransferase
MKACILCPAFGEENQFRVLDHELGTGVYRANCSRCGEYRVSQELVEDGLPPTEKARRREKQALALRLSNSTRAASDRGERRLLTHDSIRDLAVDASAPKNASDYFDRVLQAIGNSCGSPGSAPPEGDPARLAALACVTKAAFMRIVSQLSKAGLLGDPGPSVERFSCSPTIDGWKRIDELTRLRPQTDRAFIAMWFDSQMDEARSALRGALMESGYQPPFLVDDRETDADPETKSKIDDQIIAMIRRARFVVCDFTGHRQSVYYEAGYADALGTPIIWCCRKDDLHKLAFDTRQHAHIVWETPEELAAAVSAKIEARGWRLTPPK